MEYLHISPARLPLHILGIYASIDVSKYYAVFHVED